jgi:flagellar hook-basal body complex protein FliE
MVEVLCVLAVVTKEIKQNRASELTHCDRWTPSAQFFTEMILKKLVGRTDIENALQRLEHMTLEETRMTGAETLKAVHGIGNKVDDKMHGVQDALQAAQDKIEGMLQGIDGKLQGVTDAVMRGVGDKVESVDDRVKGIGGSAVSSAQAVQLALSTALIVYMAR